MKLNEKYQSLLNGYHINTPLRVAHFMAQLEHESAGFMVTKENLNYSSQGLVITFKKYFPTINVARLYAHKPDQIADKVYANRMGNGSESSRDGSKYKGRGFLQLTGKDNYTLLSKDTRIDFLNHPELLEQEANAMISACWFWNKHNLNALADDDDIKGITKVINGGLNGLEERTLLLLKYES